MDDSFLLQLIIHMLTFYKSFIGKYFGLIDSGRSKKHLKAALEIGLTIDHSQIYKDEAMKSLPFNVGKIIEKTGSYFLPYALF